MEGKFRNQEKFAGGQGINASVHHNVFFAAVNVIEAVERGDDVTVVPPGPYTFGAGEDYLQGAYSGHIGKDR